MTARTGSGGTIPPFAAAFEPLFLGHYVKLKPGERKIIDKCVAMIQRNPRHPSLQTHKAKGVIARYKIGGPGVFIAYASHQLRVTFEFGPRVGMVAFRNCGQHDRCERAI